MENLGELEEEEVLEVEVEVKEGVLEDKVVKAMEVEEEEVEVSVEEEN